MKQTAINRLTEILAALCVIAALATLAFSSGVPAVEGSLADLRTQAVPEQDMGKFHDLLDETRRLVDTNMDPEPFLGELKLSYPGRHEVWALEARYRESGGFDREALSAYARAVKLQPDYLDDGSGLFLGKRIEILTEKVLGELKKAQGNPGLDQAGKELLKTAYFLRRRIAGGCE